MADSVRADYHAILSGTAHDRTASLTLPEQVLGAIVLTLALVLPSVFLPGIDDTFALSKVTFLRVAFGASLGALAATLGASSSSRNLLPTFLSYLLLAYVGLNVLALVLSSDPRRSFLGEYQHYQGFTTAMMYVAFFYIGVRVFRSRQTVKVLFWVITLGGLPVALYALAQYLNLDPVEWDFGPGRPWRIFSSFGQPNVLAAYLVMIIPIAASMSHGLGHSGRLAILSLVSLFVAILILTISRAGYLALLITAPLAFAPLIRRPVIPRLLPLVIAALGATTALVFAVQPMADTVVHVRDRLTSLEGLEDWSLQDRMRMWSVAGEIALDEPILGAGQDTYAPLFLQHRESNPVALGMPSSRPIDPHNQYLALAASIGLPSLALYVLLITGCLALALHGARHAEMWKRRALAPVIAAILAHVVTDAFTTADVTSSWLFWLLMGAAVGIAYQPAAGRAVHRSSGWSAGFLRWSAWTRSLFARASIVIALGGLTIAALAALPLSADVVAAQGSRMADAGRWQAAALRYDRAASLNPFESRYLIRAGDAYLRLASYSESTWLWLNRALERYEAANRRFTADALALEPLPGVAGLRYPIAGACLPESDDFLPNAPRPYRAGIHEGIDFHSGVACADIARGTPVLAAAAGGVTRASWNYVEMTPEELAELLNRSQSQGYTDAQTLDRLSGRQVWIDHGGGIVTRYAHLDGIAPEIRFDADVQRGQVVGYVGNSGTPAGVMDPDTEAHLHFEIRVGDTYLGAGLPANHVRALLLRAFSVPHALE